MIGPSWWCYMSALHHWQFDYLNKIWFSLTTKKSSKLINTDTCGAVLLGSVFSLHEYHGISNKCQHDCLRNSFWGKKQKYHNQHYLTFVNRFPLWMVDSTHKRPVMQTLFPCHVVTMPQLFLTAELNLIVCQLSVCTGSSVPYSLLMYFLQTHLT